MDCLWLCDSRKAVNICVNCHHYQRNTLNSALTTESKRLKMISPGRSDARSHTNYRFCSTPEKCARLTGLHHTVRQQKKALERLVNAVDERIQKQGLRLEEPIHNDLVDIMKDHIDSIQSKYGQDSFQGIFWTQQQKSTTAANPSGRRWHPLMIKWCLYLHHLSGKAYDTIRKSGVINLPSSRTLRDYKHVSPTEVGFSVEADRQIIDLLAQKDTLAKYGVVLFDEMYVKQGLVFEKSTGALFGFTDLGEVNNQLDEFEAHLKGSSSELNRPLAKTMLVFMFKGLFTNISLPYAQFAAHSLKGHEMFPLLWKVIGRLTRIGCCILGITCDGSSPNRKLFQLHRGKQESSAILHKTENVFSKDHKDLLFFVDPPHLLKTIRNCFQSPSRKLWVR